MPKHTPSSDLFDESNEVRPNFMKWEKVGDSCQGVYVARQVVTNTLKNPPVKQAIYTLVQDGGEPIMIGGRGNQNPMVIPGLERAKLGQYIGLKYVKSIEAKKKGYNATKAITTFTKGEMRLDVLQNWQGAGIGMTDSDTLNPEVPPFDN